MRATLRTTERLHEVSNMDERFFKRQIIRAPDLSLLNDTQ